MANFLLVASFLTLTISCSHIEGRIINGTKEHNAIQNIPSRCSDNSVTLVSCENSNVTDSLLAHPDDCELFYYCVSPDQDPICRQCPAQLHFNPEKRVCDSPDRAGCTADRHPLKGLIKFIHGILQGLKDKIQSNVEEAIQARCRNNSVTNVTCDSVVTPDNLVPHPDDCQLFYYCVSPDQTPVCRQCPAELHFNPTKHVCDLPEQAGCEVINQGATGTPEWEVTTSEWYETTTEYS